MSERAANLLQNYRLFDVPAAKHETPALSGRPAAARIARNRQRIRAVRNAGPPMANDDAP